MTQESSETRLDAGEAEARASAGLKKWEWGLAAAVILSLILAILGEFYAGLGWPNLLTVALALALLPVLALLFLIAGLKRRWRRASMLFLATLLSAAAVFQGSRVIFGVPVWVQARAAPAIEALLRDYPQKGQDGQNDLDDRGQGQEAAQGRFPAEMEALSPALQKTLRQAGCIYIGNKEDPADFSLSCTGVAFTHCNYVHSQSAWFSWS